MKITEHHQKNLSYDICVVGGGIAGICAAISAARNGAKVALIQDRPVLGGNASSEIRMWVCGAPGPDNKEAGIVEELQLANQFLNPARRRTGSRRRSTRRRSGSPSPRK